MHPTNISITHDGTFDLATGKWRRETSWKNKEWLWSEFINKVSATTRTSETLGEYLTAKKQRQDEIKDVGGFVGGYIPGGRRGKGKILHRQLITLDIDFATPEYISEFLMTCCYAACLYSTHKHSPDKPRLRLIVPLDREVGPDEYEAIARRVAGDMGIELFDPTTFQPERLMYWPSTPKDATYIFEYVNGPWLCANSVLAKYHDWKDASEWPVSERYKGIIGRNIKKQGDPLEKPGIVGAFCRTYSIEDVIATFLPDVYSTCDVEGRYTYKEGSTSGGLVVYEDKYTFSHHGTDPVSMKLCNAFDLVRIHKFGLKDEDATEGLPINKMPSYEAMAQFAMSDAHVRKQLGEERLSEAFADFGTDFTEDDQPDTALQLELPFDPQWLEKLDVDKKGNYYSTIDNMVHILENDPRLRGRIVLNLFDQREAVVANLPWRELSRGNYLTDRDLANLNHYFEKVYGISSQPKIENALKVILEKNQVHPIKDYLNGLKWDGKARIATLLTEYLGVVDNPYTRAIMRKTLAAAVTRIFRPGCKFDYVLTLIGNQGLKKSMLADKLGGAWFSDSFTTVQGKEAFEQLQGAWIIEVAEMSGMRKAEVETIKHFVAKRKDRYRVSYGRRTDEFPRQCIFIATTNDRRPLRDPTGGRRFWLAVVHEVAPTKDVAVHLTQAEIDQVWAEAVELYKAGEPLFLSPELEEMARLVQEEHTEQDERIGMVQEYLNTALPENWDAMGIYERRGWLKGDELGAAGLIHREKVCAIEIAMEALGYKDTEIGKLRIKEIHDMMRTLPDWAPCKSKLNFGTYGTLKGYVYVGKKRVLSVTVGGEFLEEMM